MSKQDPRRPRESFVEASAIKLRREDTFFPPDAWGASPFQRTFDPARHVKIRSWFVPEGVVNLLICEECGGRHETMTNFLIRYGKTPTEPTAGNMEKFAELVTQALDDHLRSDVRSFVEGHMQCATRRIIHTPSERVYTFIQDQLQHAREEIGSGNDYASSIHLLLSDGGRVQVPIHMLPPREVDDGVSRGLAIQGLHAALRKLIRERDLHLDAVIVIGEGWVHEGEEKHADIPVNEKGQAEVVMAFCHTRSFAQGGHSYIRRSTGVVGEGPGTFDEPQWTFTGAESPLLDGIFAEDPTAPKSKPTSGGGSLNQHLN